MEQEHAQPTTRPADNWAGISVILTADSLNLPGRPFEPVNWRDASELGRRLSETVNKIPGYNVEAPDALFNVGMEYFNGRCNDFANALDKAGADASTISNAVVDYAGAVIDGAINYRATPQQMQTVLKAIPPLSAYFIDKYGAFNTLLRGYDLILQNIGEYQTRVKNEPDAAKRNAYFTERAKTEPFTDMEAAALFWLLNSGYITITDFDGIKQETIGAFLNYLYLYGQCGQFVQYVYIARTALFATREQLEQLNPPPLFDKSEMEPIRAALMYADAYAVYFNDYLRRIGEQLQAAILAETPEETTKAKEQAKEQAGNSIIAIPKNYALLASRQLWAVDLEKQAAKDGGRVNYILPISTVIDGYIQRNPQEIPQYLREKMEKNPDGVTLTPVILQKAIEGINLLQQFRPVEPVGGIYTFDSNLTEFSRLCNIDCANEEEKQQLLMALKILDGIFLVLWTPKGQYAQRLFTLERYGVSGKIKDILRFHVYASGFKGKPNLISRAEITLMRENEKGAAKRHFRGQILVKGHKEENALIDEVFGFTDKIREAEHTGDAGQITAAREFKRNNWANSRKKLRRWFDDWQNRGIIEYEYKKNSRGQFIYSWKRLKAPTAEELKELKPKIDYLLHRGDAADDTQPDEQ